MLAAAAAAVCPLLTGPGGCSVLAVNWEDYAAGVLAARAAVLARSEPLKSLPAMHLARLARVATCLTVESDTVLARQGTPVEGLVVVQVSEG